MDEQPAKSSHWSAGRIIGMVFTSIGGLIGIALLFGGLALVAVYAFARDDDGYYTSDREQLRSPGYALTTDEINLDFVDELPDDLLGTLRVNAKGVGGRPVFIGIGPSDDVDRYLGRVAHSELTDWRHNGPVFVEVPGGRPPTPPAGQKFWVAQSQGLGDQQIDWDPQDGVWTAVAMNAAGTRGVAVLAEIGAKPDWVLWAGIVMAAIGLVMGVGAAILILVIGRGASRRRTAEPTPSTP